MRDKVELNITQFLMALAVPFIVGAAGATVALKVSQASMEQKIEDTNRRVASAEARQERFAEDVSAVRESLARIEGALGIKE